MRESEGGVPETCRYSVAQQVGGTVTYNEGVLQVGGCQGAGGSLGEGNQLDAALHCTLTCAAGALPPHRTPPSSLLSPLPPSVPL